MSVIASFYTLPAERTLELVGFASPRDVPVTRKVFGLFEWKTSEQRSWHDYLSTHGREQAFFDWSGRMIWDLDDYLQDRGLPPPRQWGDAGLTSAATADAGATAWEVGTLEVKFVPYRVIFDRASAVRGAERLAGVAPPTAEDLGRGGMSADPVLGEPDLEDWAGRIEAARRHMIGWLESVGAGEVGVLDVG